MAMANTLDPESTRQRLRDWLATRLPGDGDVTVTDVEVPATSGMSNDTVLFRAARGGGTPQELVARIQPSGPGVFVTYDMAREYRLMQVLASKTDIPVPGVRWYEPDPGPLGAPFMIMDRVRGRIAADDPPFTAAGWVTELTPAQRALMYDNGLRALSDIHALNTDDLGFMDRPELGDTGIHQMLTHYENAYTWAARGRTFRTVEAGFDWVRANLPADEPTVLCHGDARLANLVFPDDLSVAAVLDWELAVLGSPELDLGWWLFVMRHHTDGIGVPLPDGLPTHEQTIARYEELTGHRVRHIRFYEVFAALFLSFTMIQVANVLTDAGLLPPEATMAESNPASQLLATMLGLDAPEAASSTFIGQR